MSNDFVFFFSALVRCFLGAVLAILLGGDETVSSSRKISSLDPFQDIDLMTEANEVINSNLTSVCNLTEEERYIGYTKDSGPSSDGCAEEWEKEGENEPRGAFHLFDEFGDENL